jgi:DNA-binding transcriptional LysR family regulator
MDDERLFVAVVNTGSFSAAARFEGTTQSRVSRAVLRLERRLGVSLLRRSSRAVEPTPQGRAYAEGLVAVLGEIGRIEAQVADDSRAPLRVSAPPALARRLLAPGFAAFAEAHPAVQLDVSLGARRVALIEEGVDLAVRFGPLADTWQKASLLLRGRYRIYGTPRWQHALDEDPELRDVPCLVLRVTHLRDRWPVFRGGEQRLLHVRPAHLFDDVELLLELGLAGAGVFAMADFLVRDEVARGALVPLTYDGPPAEVFALSQSDRTPVSEALVRCLRDAC